MFVSVKLTKNSDLDNYKYTRYDIGFGSRSEFLFTGESCGKNVIVFGADMSSSVNINKKGNDILFLVKDQQNNQTTFRRRKIRKKICCKPTL